ncbi:MAG: hypothetical protein LUH56_03050 [Oscillospiraceae bacterium]|nr:hypothetical protein [Oscillospiraceae bacterium]
MSERQFENEKMYLVTMSMVKSLRKRSLISEEEYCQIDTIFIEKYKPIFGTLCSEISLT